MEQAFGFFDEIYKWLNSGVYTFFTEATAYLIKSAILGYIQFLNWMVPFAWGVAKELIQDFGISSLIESAWSKLPNDIRSICLFMGVDDSLNIVLNAAVTRFVLQFLRVA
jgi:hypothetical protein